MILWLFCFLTLLVLEGIFHIATFGLAAFNPMLAAIVAAAAAVFPALIAGCFGKKGHRITIVTFTVLAMLLFSLHFGYYGMFKQPIMLRAIWETGADAVTEFSDSFWMVTLKTIPFMVVCLLPIGIYLLLVKAGRIREEKIKKRSILWILGVFAAAIVLYIGYLKAGIAAQIETVEEYAEFYDSELVLERMGVMPHLLRDIGQELGGPWADSGTQPSAVKEPVNSPEPSEKEEEGDAAEEPAAEIEATPEPGPDLSPNVWNIDMEALHALSDGGKETKWLADYIEGLAPTCRNEYTGMFEGYNLIFLTAEGFSTYAMREDLTPTLCRMVNSSFVFNNYYVPIWSTSTSDGEYVNTTGLIPDGQFSMKKSAENLMSCSLPRFFAEAGVFNRAYHNNSLTYYDRHLSHPNLGYFFKAIKLGELSEEEWGDHIFEVETPGAWPASDLEMLESTIPEYINDERFHVYYMTVSGHMNYNFKGNRMSSKNRDAVADHDLSENARAYLACNIELDKAMEYLLGALEEAGKLENTVIVMTADHYPYGMSVEQYGELAGKDLEQGMDYYRNSLFLWCGGMEEPVYVDKPCCSVDVLPTILNLFGFKYDSRMYAGRDIFSTADGLVIFKDQSFVTDKVEYNKKTKEAVWHVDMSDEDKENYIKEMRAEVRNRYLASAYILRNDYYRLVEECVVDEE